MDHRILIRQIDKDEFECYSKFFPRYNEYITKTIHSFLPKILGLYSMNYNGENCYFIVEKNMFPSVVQENKHQKWGISVASKPIHIGYVKKAQFMEKLEIDATVCFFFSVFM